MKSEFRAVEAKRFFAKPVIDVAVQIDASCACSRVRDRPGVFASRAKEKGTLDI